jgi:hypothetical protein
MEYHVVITFTLKNPDKNLDIYDCVYACFLDTISEYDSYKFSLKDCKVGEENDLPNTTITAKILASSEKEAKLKASNDVEKIFTTLKKVKPTAFTKANILVSVSTIEPALIPIEYN